MIIIDDVTYLTAQLFREGRKQDVAITQTGQVHLAFTGIELHYDLADDGKTITCKVIAEQEVLVTVERAKVAQWQR